MTLDRQASKSNLPAVNQSERQRFAAMSSRSGVFEMN
jgi:hypothetical protein